LRDVITLVECLTIMAIRTITVVIKAAMVQVDALSSNHTITDLEITAIATSKDDHQSLEQTLKESLVL